MRFQGTFFPCRAHRPILQGARETAAPGDTEPPKRPVTPSGYWPPPQQGGGSPGEKLGALRHSEREEVLPEASSNATQCVDEECLHQLMTAADVQSQLDVIMEGIGPTDGVRKGLSTLSQFLLYRQQLLNPGPGPCIVADWKALRANAGRATLIRKYQRPFTSLRNDERTWRARFLLSLFKEPSNPIGNPHRRG